MIPRPYKESYEEDTIIRKFSANTDSEELIWHFDFANREIYVIESGNWLLQMDNEIPKNLKNGDKLFIQSKVWHRLIKGSGDLVVEIREFSDH